MLPSRIGLLVLRQTVIQRSQADTLKGHGYLRGKTDRDRNVLTFKPPLVIGPEEIDGMVRALSACLDELENT